MADHDIDTLGIKITSDAQSANRSIDTLITHLDKLSQTLKGLEHISGFTTLAKGLTDLASAMNRISQKDVGSFTKVTNNIQKFNKIDHTGITEVANSITVLSGSLSTLSTSAKDVTTTADSIKTMSDSLRTLNGTKTTVDSMTQLTQAFATLSNASSQSAKILPAFAKGMKTSIDTLSQSKTVSKDLIDITEAMGSLALGMSGLANSSVNTSQLMLGFGASLKQVIADVSSLGTIDQSVIGITNALASMANGLSVLVKNANQVNTALPQLGHALREVMQILSTAPDVSQSVIQMTEALAHLSQSMKGVTGGGGGVSSARGGFAFLGKAAREFGSAVQKTDKQLSSLISKIKSFATHSQKAQSSISKFASAVGMLYVKFWLLARVVGKVWKSIESSMNYLETLNYFDAAFGQVGERAKDSWASAGYESANAYAESFSKRAKQLTKKMTGFEVDPSGNLKRTGIANLGLDPNSVMNYQAMFAQMSSSMGVTSEKALMLSNVLTEIGADLASVKNMKFEDTWKDMASGLSGMSRTLDKYGVNIRNANLNQKLMQLGIDTTVDKLSQADKALLRTIVLLDSTTYAWGDLADTINSPANQIRILTANLQQLGRMIGSLFLPLVTKLLPYINGLVIALQRLVQYVASLFGIDMSDFIKNTGASNEAISDILDESDDLGESIDDAAESAKKLKNHLLGIDELNIINENDDKKAEMPDVGGLLDDAFMDAVSNYQKAWDEAFKRLENEAERIADKIAAWAKRAFEPIGKAWEAQGEYVKESFGKMLDSIGNLVKDIARDWATVWYQPQTEEIFEHIFRSLGNIFQFIGNIADGIDRAWNYANNGLRILQALRDIILEIAKGVDNITAEWARWAKEDLDFTPLFSALASMLETVADKMKYVREIVEDFNKTLVEPLVEHFIEVTLPKLITVFENFLKKIDWEKLKKNLHTIFEALEHLGEVALDGIVVAIERFADAVADFINSSTFQKLVQTFHDWAMNLTAEDVADLIERIVKALLLFKGVSFVTGVISGLAEKFSWLGTIIKGLVEMSHFRTLKGLLEDISGNRTISLETKGVKEATEEVGKLSGGWKGVISSVGQFAKKVAGVGLSALGTYVAINGFFDLWNNGFSVAGELAFGFGTVITAIGAILLGVNPIVAAVVGGIVFLVGNLVVAIKQNWDEISEYWSETWHNMIEGLKTWVVSPWADWFKAFKEDLKNHDWASLGLDIIKGIFLVFLTPLAIIFQAVKAFFGFVVGAIKGIFGIHSPAESMKPYGEFILLGIVEGFKGGFEAFWSVIQGLFEKIGEWIGGFIDGIASFFDGIAEKFSNFGNGVSEAWEKISSTVSNAWNGIKETTAQMVSDAKQKVKDWIDAGWEKISDKAESLRSGLAQKWETIKSNTKDMVEDFKQKIVEWATNKWDDLESNLKQAVDIVAKKWDEVKEGFQKFRDEYMPQILEWADGVKENAQKGLEEVRSKIQEKWGEVKQNFIEFREEHLKEIADWLSQIFVGVKDKYEEVKKDITERVDAIKQNFSGMVKEFSEKKDTWLKGVRDEVPKAFATMSEAIRGKWDEIKTKAAEFFPKMGGELYNYGKQLADKFGNGFENMPKTIETVIGKAKDAVSKGLQNIGSWVNEAWGSIKDFAEKAWSKINNAKNGVLDGTSFSFNFPKYATGGFPEDGLFFANHNELVGKFSNGKTAVANNEQIISGIEQATYNAMMRANSNASSREEDLLRELISAVKQGSKISIDGREIVTAYDTRKSRNGYAF